MALTLDDRYPDCIYVYDMGCELVYQYDVKQGLLEYEGNPMFSPYPKVYPVQYDVKTNDGYFQQKYGYACVRYAAKETAFRFGTKSIKQDLGCTLWYRPRMEQYLSPAQQRLLISLASRQVKGGEILKGLKSLGMDVKGVGLQQNYLGGWNIRLFGEDVTVLDFVLHF